MRVERTHFILGASGLATTGLLRFPAGAAEFTYKLAHSYPLTDPVGARSQEAVDRTNRETGGRLEIKTFPNAQLGGQQAVLSQVRLGSVEFSICGDNGIQNVIPVAGVTAVPFSFTTYKDAWNAVDGALGGVVRDAMAKANLYRVGKEWDIGFRQMFSNVRPINAPDDLKGMKMRIPEGQNLVAMFKALGAIPTALSIGETYAALQTHLVDGFDQTIDGMESLRYYEVSKYVSITNHAWTGFTIVGNLDTWQKLPQNIRDIVERNFSTSATQERNDIMRGDTALIPKLKAQGQVFNQPDMSLFRNAVSKAGLYTQWRDTFGTQAWALLEKAVGKLT